MDFREENLTAFEQKIIDKENVYPEINLQNPKVHRGKVTPCGNYPFAGVGGYITVATDSAADAYELSVMVARESLSEDVLLNPGSPGVRGGKGSKDFFFHCAFDPAQPILFSRSAVLVICRNERAVLKCSPQRQRSLDIITKAAGVAQNCIPMHNLVV
ncbi:hypothetical protein RhiirC2_718283 [Rhizophagus irregularis]|uniref:Uncharacterized protein n=1 Tax=Rhizophagus irregularis TaxID=588596 RepID=A0A2N1MJ10_9GLOM|nr:hypothetical protein RhiirC2_718283 [Rhizophagus irregularis]